MWFAVSLYSCICSWSNLCMVIPDTKKLCFAYIVGSSGVGVDGDNSIFAVRRTIRCAMANLSSCRYASCALRYQKIIWLFGSVVVVVLWNAISSSMVWIRLFMSYSCFARLLRFWVFVSSYIVIPDQKNSGFAHGG